MSHISRLKTKMVNKKFLLQALDDMGLSYEMDDAQIFGFNHRETKVDIKINLPDSYPVGLRERNGSYEIIADWWGVRGLNKEKFRSLLMQRYAYHAACEALQNQGFDLISEDHQPDGKIHLTLRRVN